ncbi:MAG: sigma-54-dependent Fis family transcriptional regulator [Kordiimonas sp.]|nr:sigma-54-dependent Fis family transcriptional regulator [Kordiimonas sp.]
MRNKAIDDPSSFNTPSFEDLRAAIQFNPDNAEIWLDQHRMVLTDNNSLGIMKLELVQALGYARARALLSRIGYEIGASEVDIALKIRKDKDLFEAYSAGPQIHALKGSVRVEPIVFDVDRDKGHFYVEYNWHNSAECQAHVKHLGIGATPGGWQQVGYASGFTSAFMGCPVIYRETECVAMGHDKCFLVGKTAKDWENPDEELQWFRSEAYSIRPTKKKRKNTDIENDLKIGKRSIVGASAGFNVSLHLIDKVAQTNTPVLFLGESGVGKEVLAQELHKRSSRADKQIIAVNCAAIPDTLVEAELFGVEKGAYTGADRTRPGRFERASGGTLFLDEIGTLSLAAQGKLLRVLQTGIIEKVGGTKEQKTDVRLIAATNADLRADVEAGTFREDLFHRLNIFPIHIPPLRERHADIPLLINHFLRRFSDKHNKEDVTLSEEALRALLTYDWPGNIRELENIIERGVILADEGHPIDIYHLAMNIGSIHAGSKRQEDPFKKFITHSKKHVPNTDIGMQLLDQGFSSEEVVDNMIQAALDRSNNNVSDAARRTGMTRSQINYWIKKQRTQP